MKSEHAVALTLKKEDAWWLYWALGSVTEEPGCWDISKLRERLYSEVLYEDPGPQGDWYRCRYDNPDFTGGFYVDRADIALLAKVGEQIDQKVSSDHGLKKSVEQTLSRLSELEFALLISEAT